MRNEIRLRSKKDKALIVGTLEESRERLAFEDVTYSPGPDGNYGIDQCGPSEPHWDGTDTVIRDGQTVFVDANSKEVVSSEVEPFVDGMSSAMFLEFEVRLRFLAPGGESVRKPIARALDRMPIPPGYYVYREEGDALRRINATEMALALTACGADPAEVGLRANGIPVDTILDTDDRPIEVAPVMPEPGHPLEEWRNEVVLDETQLGYVEWAHNRAMGAEADGKKYCRTCGDLYDIGGDGYRGECPRCADISAEGDPSV